MSGTPVLFEVSAGIATLTLNEPARMNPLTPELQAGCIDALERVHADTSIRVLVVTANGKGFCVGADLAALAAHEQLPVSTGCSRGDYVAQMMEEGGNRIVATLRNLPVPVLCAVNGATAGGGVGLALAADVVVAARSAYFYLPFIPALGAIPDLGSSWFLPRSLGRARAMGLTLLGDRLSAEQAVQWGLIWSCVEDSKLPDEAGRIAARLAALPSHAALETRALYRASQAHTFDEQLAYERERQRELVDREYFEEGVRAFMEKRRPLFAGRSSR